ncbi:hypothetical protein DRN75_00135 [Nanoarchaeota archaeon]|nr:MAG: hypothetical protein DRN75_00135 [Nanoarchaeota archaeon]
MDEEMLMLLPLTIIVVFILIGLIIVFSNEYIRSKYDIYKDLTTVRAAIADITTNGYTVNTSLLVNNKILTNYNMSVTDLETGKEWSTSKTNKSLGLPCLVNGHIGMVKVYV